MKKSKLKKSEKGANEDETLINANNGVKNNTKN